MKQAPNTIAASVPSACAVDSGPFTSNLCAAPQVPKALVVVRLSRCSWMHDVNAEAPQCVELYRDGEDCHAAHSIPMTPSCPTAEVWCVRATRAAGCAWRGHTLPLPAAAKGLPTTVPSESPTPWLQANPAQRATPAPAAQHTLRWEEPWPLMMVPREACSMPICTRRSCSPS
jgi:hypothetical protein